MNENLAAYKKLKDTRKPRQRIISLKDVLTVSLSIFALVISATTAYFNLLRQTHIARVIMHRSPDVTISGSGKILYVKTRFNDVSFINAGNQSVAISNLSVILIQSDVADVPPNCRDTDERDKEFMSRSDYDIKTFVVEPGQIAYKQITLTLKDEEFYQIPERLKNEGAVVFETRGEFTSERFVLTCLGLDVITPQYVHRGIRVPLDHFKFERLESRWVRTNMWEITGAAHVTTIVNEISTPLYRSNMLPSEQ